MGFSRKRVGKNGKIRYNACYRDLRGTVLSAGTFATEKASDRAWQKAEVELRQGRVGDPARGRQRFRKYVEERWLPHHVLEPTSHEKYTYYLGAFIYPVLAKLRVNDLDLVSRMLSRKVIEVNREFHPEGKRFLVKHYPKDKEYRRLKLTPQIVAKLKAHAQAHNLGPGGLLFARRPTLPAPLHAIIQPEALGFTAANEAGRQYRHGTLSAYNAANAAASTADARSPTTGPSAGQPPPPSAGLPG